MTRDTYKYHFKRGHRIVHTGITNDLERRESEHKQISGVMGTFCQLVEQLQELLP